MFGCAEEQEAVILPHGSGDRLVGVGSVVSSVPPSRLARTVSAHAGRERRGGEAAFGSRQLLTALGHKASARGAAMEAVPALTAGSTRKGQAAGGHSASA